MKHKSPWKTLQCFHACLKWERRSRKGERFACVLCGHAAHTDGGAARNLALIGTVGACGLGILKDNNPV